MVRDLEHYLDDLGNYYVRGYFRHRYYFNDFPSDDLISAVDPMLNMMFGKNRMAHNDL